MEDVELKKVLETLLFITDAPLPVSRLAQLCEIKNTERLNNLLAEIKTAYDTEGRALQVMQVAGGWQLATRPEHGIWVRKLYHNKMTVRLTQAALETLCIIAYKQPLTRAEVEAIRGVEAIGPLETLTQRKLITVVGRRESIGRPILYGTTSEFLRQFGLNSLDDLPKLESFKIENPALAAQTIAVELAEEEQEPVAEGAPPADPLAGAEAPEAAAGQAPEAPAEEPVPFTEEQAGATLEAQPETPVEEAASLPAEEPLAPSSEEHAETPAEPSVEVENDAQPVAAETHDAETPVEAAPEEPRDNN